MVTTARVGVILVDAARHYGPHCGPHISATPRNETDSGQHDSLKTNDMRDETDTPQPFDSSS
jgi:hypothetical protein